MASESTPPSYASCIEMDTSIDVMFQYMHRNQARSPLLRLPLDTLRTLFRSLELDSILRLRHTSRAFLHLFHEDFSKPHQLTQAQNPERFKAVARIWAPPVRCFAAQGTIQVTNICDGCARTRGGGDDLGRQILHTMPSLHCTRCDATHSAMHFSLAQRQVPESMRICIGHEGLFYLCDHISLTWHQLKSMEYAKFPARIYCNSSTHYHGQPKCDDAACLGQDSLHLEVNRDPDTRFSITVSLREHIQIKRLPSGKICGRSLREALPAARLGMENTCWLPSQWPVTGDPLRAFDPNLCDCVDWYSGRGENYRHRLPFHLGLSKAWRRPVSGFDRISENGLCSDFAHMFKADGATIIGFLQCSSQSDVLVMVQQRDYFFDDPCSPEWVKGIDLSSYDQYWDEEMKGITWCDESTCSVSQLANTALHITDVEMRAKKEDVEGVEVTVPKM